MLDGFVFNTKFKAAFKTDSGKMCKAQLKPYGSMSNINHAAMNLHEC